jgi:hypothetical protein
LHHAADAARSVPAIGGLLEAITPTLLTAIAGVIAGGVALAIVSLATRLVARFRKTG